MSQKIKMLFPESPELPGETGRVCCTTIIGKRVRSRGLCRECSARRDGSYTYTKDVAIQTSDSLNM